MLNGIADTSERRSFGLVLVRRRRSVAIVSFADPTNMNALSAELAGSLETALADCSADPSVEVVVLTGSPKVFARTDTTSWHSKVSGSWLDRNRFPKPIIAAVAGYALGAGLELVAECDFAIASSTSKFGYPDACRGWHPNPAGIKNIAQLIQRSAAMDLVLTGRTVDAHTAERMGIVARVVPAVDLLEEAITAAHRVAVIGPDDISVAMRLINEAYEPPGH